MIEEKIARICWNTNHWQKPSGREGKTKNKTAYEFIKGYGHEEWLLDTEKIIDGYHYAFLQAIGGHRDTYVGKTFNISFYSINSQTKERWWIGTINNLEVVTAKESKRIYQIYKKNRWLQEMKEHLKDVGANSDDFDDVYQENFTTIRYKISDLDLLDTPIHFSSDDPAIKSDYYNLKNKICDPQVIIQPFTFVSGHNEGKTSTTTTYDKQKQKKDLAHNRMQTQIYNHLTRIYGKRNVGTEQKIGEGSRIDLVVRERNDFAYTFYELKTSNSLRKCIREALSQLLEYAYYPKNNNAVKLIIVSQNPITQDNQQYLKLLRSTFNLPVFYQRYNPETGELEPDEY